MAAKRQGGSGREKGVPGRAASGKTARVETRRAGESGADRAPLPPGSGARRRCGLRHRPVLLRRRAASGRFPVVGIGASAGGLEALQEFFGNMPADTGMGFVVVTHQHPGHVSMLPALLARSTRMPVVEATDGMRVEPNHVYVGAPGRAVGDRRRRAASPGCRLGHGAAPAHRPFLPLVGGGSAGARHLRGAFGHGDRRHAGDAGRQGRGGDGHGPGSAVGQVCRNARQRRGHRAGRLCPAPPPRCPPS